MSWFLAFAGFALLIILHEFGHFAAAKLTGMRVERFALFFPPLILKWKPKNAETEYGIGAIPLGGYVKITGMNRREELPEEVAYRAYYRQRPWKRIVVIAAGPAMNVLVAFVIFFALFVAQGRSPSRRSARWPRPSSWRRPRACCSPATRSSSVDGVSGSPDRIRKQISTHRCAGAVSRRLPGHHARRRSPSSATAAP